MPNIKLVPVSDVKDLLMGLDELPWEENVVDLVDSLPTVEAVESQWKYYHKQNVAVCLNCSFERDLSVSFGKAVSCPNCGAIMR